MRPAFCLATLLTLLSAAPAPAQQSDFVRILLPITSADTPGSFGSLWTTEIWFRNDSTTPTSIFPLIGGDQGLTRGVTLPLSIDRPPAGAPPGQFVYILKAAEADFRFQVRVRDLSRQRGSFGVEIPVAHDDDFIDHPLSLIQVPTSARFRAMVRIYDAGAGGAGTVHVAAVDEKTEQVLAATDLSLPTTGFPLYSPGYAQLGPLTASLPGIAAAERIRIELTPSSGARIWAFISITDNETQEITTITPR